MKIIKYYDEYVKEWCDLFEPVLGFLPECGISDEGKAILMHKAYTAICNYLGYKIAIDDCIEALAELTKVYIYADIQDKKALAGDKDITQQTQGSRSTTYARKIISLDKNGLTEMVKAILPVPRMKVF